MKIRNLPTKKMHVSGNKGGVVIRQASQYNPGEQLVWLMWVARISLYLLVILTVIAGLVAASVIL